MAAFMNRLGALGPGKIPVVNADKIDGLDSSALARPMYAVVNSNGTLARGAAVSSVLRQDVGRYRVGFNRDISTCAFTGTLGNAGGGFPQTGTIVVAFSDTPETNDIYIETRDAVELYADRSFHLQTSCVAGAGAITGVGPEGPAEGTGNNAE
jgi:hypothetical protein